MQLVELQAIQEAFTSRGFSIVALSQEDKDIESARRFLKHWPSEPEFPIVADLNREVTSAYDRTTAYLIDQKGIVRQVFPMLIHMRPTGHALVREIDRLELAVASGQDDDER